MRGSGVFHGRVLQADGQSPVEGATVRVVGYPKTATLTTSTGEFTAGPGRKWYWYTVIGLHEHIVPEPVWPKLSTSIMVGYADHLPVFLNAGPKAPAREIVKQRFEVGDILLDVPEMK
jgi:hypothetical protein